ncbi:hypothetical protein GTR02_14760 [Kineococcus sp. R8]|uniref:oxygenase MpaB family protein n=1 Tax=Kineococcus siccus TaxID=2696567 RepID=UPI001412A968|nr:hypothetical protein [Kineococcus siccus]NAZ83078.1 hypothetical protein [Kineococcus siccus]
METTRTPSGTAPPVSPALHAGASLEVALLAAAVLEEAHPTAARALAEDPRHPWQRVQDAAALLRAGTDPGRALALAARERATASAPGAVLVLRHALRVDLVLRTAAAGGRAPSDADAERYVREQVSTAVLGGAEPEDVPHRLADVRAVLDDVRRALRGGASLGRLPSRQLGGPHAQLVPGWREAAALAPAVLPGWAPHARPAERGELARALRRLDAASAALSPHRR